MGVDGEAPVADVDCDPVAAGVLRCRVFAGFVDPQVRIAVYRGHHGTVGHREDGLTEGGKTGGQQGIADAGPVLGVQLVEVDRKPLGE